MSERDELGIEQGQQLAARGGDQGGGGDDDDEPKLDPDPYYPTLRSSLNMLRLIAVILVVVFIVVVIVVDCLRLFNVGMIAVQVMVTVMLSRMISSLPAR